MSCANAFNKAILTINGKYFSGVDSQTTVTIVSNPNGTAVSGSDNTFDYENVRCTSEPSHLELCSQCSTFVLNFLLAFYFKVITFI